MRNVIYYLLLLTLCSCKAELRELCYDHNHAESAGNVELVLSLELDLHLDFPVSVEDHTTIVEPTYMKVCFYDINDGHLVKTEYVGAYGGRIDVSPGTYDLVVYAFGTEWTIIRNENNRNTLEAYTSDVTAQKASTYDAATRNAEGQPETTESPIIYTPDHLLVTKERMTVPVATQAHQVITIKTSAATIIETYDFKITHVKGLENIKSVEAFVTNQARSNYFGRGEVNQQPAIISFPIEVDKEKGILHTTFNTFGKLPGESHSYLHVVFTNTDGEVITASSDITEQFEGDDHEITIDVPIDIPEPKSGGIDPTVDPWDEENHDVPIG